MGRKIRNQLHTELTVDDRASPAFAGAGMHLKKMLGLMAGGYGVYQFTNAITGQARAMIQTNIEFEKFNVSLEVLYGSADKAKQKMDWIIEFAKKTPFELPELVQATINLKAFGLEAENWAEKIGNLAAGTNKPIDQAVDALGKLASGLNGIAIRQFQYMGISRQMWAEQGIAFNSMGSALAGTEEMLGALSNIIEGRFGGLMQRQSQTMGGMLTNLQDFLSIVRMELGKTIFEEMKGDLGAIVGFVEELSESGKMNEWVQTLSRSFADLYDALGPTAWALEKLWKLQQMVSAVGSGSPLGPLQTLSFLQSKGDPQTLRAWALRMAEPRSAGGLGEGYAAFPGVGLEYQQAMRDRLVAEWKARQAGGGDGASADQYWKLLKSGYVYTPPLAGPGLGDRASGRYFATEPEMDIRQRRGADLGGAWGGGIPYEEPLGGKPTVAPGPTEETLSAWEELIGKHIEINDYMEAYGQSMTMYWVDGMSQAIGRAQDFGDVWNNAWDMFGRQLQRLAGMGLFSLLGWASPAFGGAGIGFGAAFEWISGHQSGAQSVPETGLYHLHRGEQVVPAHMAHQQNNGGGDEYHFHVAGPAEREWVRNSLIPELNRAGKLGWT